MHFDAPAFHSTVEMKSSIKNIVASCLGAFSVASFMRKLSQDCPSVGTSKYLVNLAEPNALRKLLLASVESLANGHHSTEPCLSNDADTPSHQRLRNWEDKLMKDSELLSDNFYCFCGNSATRAKWSGSNKRTLTFQIVFAKYTKNENEKIIH